MVFDDFLKVGTSPIKHLLQFLKLKATKKNSLKKVMIMKNTISKTNHFFFVLKVKQLYNKIRAKFEKGMA